MERLRSTDRLHKWLYKYLFLLLITAVSFHVDVGGRSAQAAESASTVTLRFADVADLATAAPIIIDGQIKRAKKVKIPSSTPSSPAAQYTLVTAKVYRLIRGDGGVAKEVSFLVADRSGIDAASFKPKRGSRVMIYARPGKGQDQVQLVSRHAMQPWSAQLDETTRTLALEMLRPDAPPAILSVGDAFHSAGTIVGEGETQVFLVTQTGEPVSLSIIHRPGQQLRWGVSLGEIVDETAVPPSRNTLLWYRLACGLPDSLPAKSTRNLVFADAQAAWRDYRFVIESLGSCGRAL